MTRTMRIIFYSFSRNKRQLDTYMKLIRQGKTLSDSEVTKLKLLIDNENKIYGR